jgi:hypothetical protein
MFEWIRFLIAAALLLGGLGIMCIGVIGTYRFKYVLNRMHAAAMNDTLGILLIMLSLIVMSGFTFTSLKLLLIALERQGASFPSPIPDEVVGFEPGLLDRAIAYAKARRETGHTVALLYNAPPEELHRRAQQNLTRQAVYITRDVTLTWNSTEAT